MRVKLLSFLIISVNFGLVGGDARIALGGGMSSKNVPLGFLVVEGDDVRVELLPKSEDKSSVLRQLVQAILDRKIVFILACLLSWQLQGQVQVVPCRLWCSSLAPYKDRWRM
jgi:hypothetical protein